MSTAPPVELALLHPEVAAAVAELREVADRLVTRRRGTDRAVDVLLDGGWSGRAAVAFAEGWQDWRSGCDEVLAALATMAELVAVARGEVAEQDEAAAAGLRALTVSLGGAR
jgi:WXG100 family type VII secretion target